MNKIMEVARLLGFEPFEEFEIKDYGVRYRFADDEFQHELCGRWFLSEDDATLAMLIYGDLNIIRLPYQPKDGDVYWTYQGRLFIVDALPWTSTAFDYSRQAAGIVFRTKEEAEKHRAEIYKKFTGKELYPND